MSMLGASGRPESSIMVLARPAEQLVGPWRARYDPTSPIGVPAHITLLYPFVEPDEIDDMVVEGLRNVLAAFEPFAFQLAKPARFPGVLYLAPDPAEPFVAMTAAIAQRWPQAPPYGGAFERLVPHLTVARLDDPARLDEIQAVITPALPIEAFAASACLLVQSDDGRWWIRARLSLGKR